tara:strand:- start:871 stop:1443 length:573 start_codon:yes stop_codon:yes gene_type:complete
MINVFCLKCDKKYNRRFVTKLKDSVNKHLTKKHKFFCMTDKPEEKWDIPIVRKFPDVWNKMHFLNYVGDSLYFDLDIEIHDNIDFLADDFEHFTIVDSRRWKKQKEDLGFKVSNNTFINSSIMRWSFAQDIYQKFANNSDTYLRLYKGIDRFIYNENISYKYFNTDKIMSWKEENYSKKVISLYNGRFKN